MSVVKLHRYGVRAHPRPSSALALTLEAPGKAPVEVALPPDFKGGISGVWTPEELLIGSLASCFELTLLAIAERRGVPIHDVRTDVTGHLRSKNGIYRFVLFEVDVLVTTTAGCEHHAEAVASLAKERCIVAGALEVPIRLSVKVQTHGQELATA